jgi:ribose 5-phosphate isomerase A
MTTSQKQAAALAALDFLNPLLCQTERDVALGLGTGSTVQPFLEALATRDLKHVRFTSTSKQTEAAMASLGLPLTDFNECDFLDATIDGADVLDAQGRLIKGGGGALLREKMVAERSHQMIVIADASKSVEDLAAFPLPVECIAFGWKHTEARVHAVCERLGLRIEAAIWRQTKDKTVFLTDQSNRILDVRFKALPNPESLAKALKAEIGVVEHGLFTHHASVIFIATDSGIEKRIYERTTA